MISKMSNVLMMVIAVIAVGQVGESHAARRAPGAVGFPMAGIPIAYEPGQYNYYNIDVVEKRLLDLYESKDNEDYQYVLEAIREINSSLGNINKALYQADGLNDLMMANLSGPVSMVEFFKQASQIEKLKNEAELNIGNITAVPSVMARKPDTFKAPTNTIQIPRRAQQLDMSPLTQHGSKVLATMLKRFEEATYQLRAPNGALLKVVGLKLNVEPGQIWDSSVYESLQIEARKMMATPQTAKTVIANFNLTGSNLMNGLVSTFGERNNKFGRWTEMNSQGVEDWLSQLGQYFFTRARMRLNYGRRLGAPYIPELKSERFYVEMLKGVQSLNFKSATYVTEDATLREIQNNIFYHLTLAETQSKIGAPLTKENSTTLSIVSVINWGRSAITGSLWKAKMNAAVLAMLYVDISDELLAETLGGVRKLSESFKKRFVVGKSSDEMALYREWNCAVSSLMDNPCASSSESEDDVGDSSDPFADNPIMVGEDGFMAMVRDAINLGFKVMLVRAEQARVILESANALSKNMQTVRQDRRRSDAINDMFDKKP